jgi:hypothetical protein
MMMTFIACILHRILLGWLNQGGWGGGTCGTHGERRSVYCALVGRPKGKRPLGTLRHRWEHKIKMDLGKIGSMGRTGFGWLSIGSMAGFCEHGNEPSGFHKIGCCLTSWVTIRFSKNILHHGVSKYERVIGGYRTQYFLVPYYQRYQHCDRANSWGGSNTRTV